VARDNRAAAYPTDFALIELPAGGGAPSALVDDGPSPAAAAAGEAAAQLAESLGRSFRDINPDKRFTPGALKGIWDRFRPQRRAQAAGGRQQKHERSLLGAGGGGGTPGAPPPAPAQAPAPAKKGSRSPAPADDVLTVQKPPGRFSTRPTIGLDPSDPSARERDGELHRRRRRGRALLQSDTRVTTLLKAGEIWAQGFTGKGVKVRGGGGRGGMAREVGRGLGGSWGVGLQRQGRPGQSPQAAASGPSSFPGPRPKPCSCTRPLAHTHACHPNAPRPGGRV
jgi:hypothetical protein